MTEITDELIAKFRALPFGFSDVTKWPDSVIRDALCEADAETGGRGWGVLDLSDCENFKWRGMRLFAAHWLSTMFGKVGTTKDPSSEARLNVAEKSVGDESVAYRVPSMMDAGNDWLTYTNYGQQFYRLRRRAGMGARAV